MAMPGGRHAHAAPTPLLGGLAMFVGFAVAVLIFVPSSLTRTGVLVVSGDEAAANPNVRALAEQAEVSEL